ncbi:sulfurtransferase [Thiomicrorhabdus sp. Milos-T2]|uniref:sulfurtransferase n=1 Tax=Thiomicrorhabdus sp. Milos-T2 TaxID=90814 RepID=UPI000494BD05|nr:rhodanese-like domain-containing protein [Thiomicrorhabdus sp. Milos-T2]
MIKKLLKRYGVQIGASALAMALLLSVPLVRAADIGPLVSVAWLKQHANDPHIAILDIRSDRKDYLERGHIPQARLWDKSNTKNLVDLKGIGQVMPTAKGVADLLGKLGVKSGDAVVLTNNGRSPQDVTFATRAYWALRYYGVNDIAILDGGTGKWASEGLPISHDAAPTPVATTLQQGVPPVRAVSAIVGVNWAYTLLDKQKTEFIDARPPKVFMGQDKPPFDPKYGHIPGAVSWPASELFTRHPSKIKGFQEYFTFKNRDEIESSARAHRVNLNRAAIVYCDTGHLSSGVFFAWREILKKDNLKFFPGSMRVWGEQNLPTAMGK